MLNHEKNDPMFDPSGIPDDEVNGKEKNYYKNIFIH